VDSLKALAKSRKQKDIQETLLTAEKGSCQDALKPMEDIVMTSLSHHDSFDPEIHMEWINLFRENNYADFINSESRLDILAKTYQMLKQRDIKSVFFINPLHPQIRQLIKEKSLEETFNRWKSELRQVIPDLVDLTKEEYGYTDPQYFVINDPSHYLPQAGERFINEILLGIDSNK